MNAHNGLEPVDWQTDQCPRCDVPCEVQQRWFLDPYFVPLLGILGLFWGNKVLSFLMNTFGSIPGASIGIFLGIVVLYHETENDFLIPRRRICPRCDRGNSQHFERDFGEMSRLRIYLIDSERKRARQMKTYIFILCFGLATIVNFVVFNSLNRV